MAHTSGFFKEGEKSFGIFYPTGYVLSGFASAEQADQAAAALRDAGFAADDVMVATGAEVVAHSREFRENVGLFARFERFVAGLYGEEANVADELVRLAERDHTFVAVHAPDDAATERAAETIRRFHPVLHRKFGAFTYTDLH